MINVFEKLGFISEQNRTDYFVITQNGPIRVVELDDTFRTYGTTPKYQWDFYDADGVKIDTGAKYSDFPSARIPEAAESFRLIVWGAVNAIGVVIMLLRYYRPVRVE